MAEEKVMFLGEEYIFPEELREYINYCNEFEKINNRLSDSLLVTMKMPILSENDEPDQLGYLETKFKDKMRQEGKQVISMLSKHNIFDITESDLVDNNKGYLYYADVYKKCFAQIKQNLIDELDSFLEGFDNAQQSAYSQITGTGISMYSSSIIAHMTLAAFETSTVKMQCEKADREYERAMDEMSKRTASERERKDMAVMIKAYSDIADAVSMFISELMHVFFTKLQENSIFNYSKVEIYDIKRSTELLKNLSLVDNKKSVLVQAFRNCPYNPDIYQQVLLYGMCDMDTFKTAQHFYQNDILLSIIEDYCKNNLKNDNISESIAVLAYYKGVDTREIWRSMYDTEIKDIESKYIELHTVLKDNVCLCRWIKDNITKSTDNLLKKSIDDIANEITKKIDNIVSENVYNKYISMDLIRPETLRLSESQSTNRSSINSELTSKLMECVIEYIAEAI
ncbi:hypothetical protein GPL15_04560, partial [Clostridium sp. MCC353]|uniref:hypothetical protein n=1 Tax=Clostridium sp. MCC353 TaxID=2592646 RepID=UPI001C01F23D